MKACPVCKHFSPHIREGDKCIMPDCICSATGEEFLFNTDKPWLVRQLEDSGTSKWFVLRHKAKFYTSNLYEQVAFYDSHTEALTAVSYLIKNDPFDVKIRSVSEHR
jgi:hypothetical protein